jgi:hypothetical protein
MVQGKEYLEALLTLVKQRALSGQLSFSSTNFEEARDCDGKMAPCSFKNLPAYLPTASNSTSKINIALGGILPDP